MSFFTALSLSFNNLRTKKGRTCLTAFAGSIGIIGIALILAPLSTGMNAISPTSRKKPWSPYPITISDETVDVSGLIGMQGEIVGESKATARAGRKSARACMRTTKPRGQRAAYLQHRGKQPDGVQKLPGRTLTAASANISAKRHCLFLWT